MTATYIVNGQTVTREALAARLAPAGEAPGSVDPAQHARDDQRIATFLRGCADRERAGLPEELADRLAVLTRHIPPAATPVRRTA